MDFTNEKDNADLAKAIKKVEQDRHDEKVTTLFMRLIFGLSTSSISTVILITYFYGIDNHRLVIFFCLLSYTSFYFVLELNKGIFDGFNFNKNGIKRMASKGNFFLRKKYKIS